MEEIGIQDDKSSFNPWLAGSLAWALPGAGHFLQGHIVRGGMLGGAVFCMYFIGWLLGGHLYGLHNAAETGFLAYIFGFCDLGSGLLYLFSLTANISVLDQSHLATSEYGDRFLMVAGLLNYLCMLDAFDIAVGRKR